MGLLYGVLRRLLSVVWVQAIAMTPAPAPAPQDLHAHLPVSKPQALPTTFTPSQVSAVWVCCMVCCVGC